MEEIKIIIDSPTGKDVEVQILGLNNFIFSYSGEDERTKTALIYHYKDKCKNIICNYDPEKDLTRICANNGEFNIIQ